MQIFDDNTYVSQQYWRFIITLVPINAARIRALTGAKPGRSIRAQGIGARSPLVSVDTGGNLKAMIATMQAGNTDFALRTSATHIDISSPSLARLGHSSIAPKLRLPSNILAALDGTRPPNIDLWKIGAMILGTIVLSLSYFFLTENSAEIFAHMHDLDFSALIKPIQAIGSALAFGVAGVVKASAKAHKKLHPTEIYALLLTGNAAGLAQAIAQGQISAEVARSLQAAITIYAKENPEAAETLQALFAKHHGEVPEDVQKRLADVIGGISRERLQEIGNRIQSRQMVSTPTKISQRVITIDMIPRVGNNYNVVAVSDLHNGPVYEDDVRQLATQVRCQSPDIVVIAGDLGESLEHYRLSLNFFTDESVTVVVPGNHDLWNKSVQVGDTTFAFSSMDLWETVLPGLTNISGGIWLDGGPIIIKGARLAIVGTIGWYDYSGDQSERTSEEIEQGKGNYIRDNNRIDWPVNDQKFAGQRYDQLRRDLDEVSLSPFVDEILVVTHVPPFVELEPEEAKGKRYHQSRAAYYYNPTLGSLITKYPKVTRVVSGHTHCGVTAVVERAGMPDIEVTTIENGIRADSISFQYPARDIKLRPDKDTIASVREKLIEYDRLHGKHEASGQVTQILVTRELADFKERVVSEFIEGGRSTIEALFQLMRSPSLNNDNDVANSAYSFLVWISNENPNIVLDVISDAWIDPQTRSSVDTYYMGRLGALLIAIGQDSKTVLAALKKSYPDDQNFLDILDQRIGACK